jgi:hypothetical protein
MEFALPAVSPKAASLRFWYGASIAEFVAGSADSVLAQLTRNCEFALLPTQREAWLAQTEFLHAHLKDLTGSIFFEFNIPRMGRRIDVVLVIGPVIFMRRVTLLRFSRFWSRPKQRSARRSNFKPIPTSFTDQSLSTLQLFAVSSTARSQKSRGRL